MLLCELYCAPHYTQIACDRYYTLYYTNLPFHSFVQTDCMRFCLKIKKFYYVQCAVCRCLYAHHTPMEWQKLWTRARHSEIPFYSVFGDFHSYFFFVSKFSSNSMLMHSYEPVTKWINCKCDAIISFCLHFLLQWICNRHISVFAIDLVGLRLRTYPSA